MASSCVAVLGSVLVAPILPQISKHFAETAQVSVLAPMVLTVPALMIGLAAPLAGQVIDAHGRRSVIITALLAFTIFGVAPLWLDSLQLIVASRVGLGIAEAFILTSATTLLGDYFTGLRRDRAFSLQAVLMPLTSVASLSLSGAIGSTDWRRPFWLFLSSLAVAAAVMATVREPRRPADRRAVPDRGAAPAPVTQLEPVSWRAVSRPLTVSLAGGLIFFSVLVELPYLLDGLGVTSATAVGGATGLTALTAASGAASFPRLARSGSRLVLPSAFALAGIGLLGIGMATSVPGLLIGAAVATYGLGLLLPTVLTWVQADVSFSVRGRITGAWTAAFYFGQFATPLLLLEVSNLVGGLMHAVAVLGCFSLLVAMLVYRRAR